MHITDQELVELIIKIYTSFINSNTKDMKYKMNLISQLTFANPLALWALLSVPAVWLLIKIFPPAPKNIIFHL